jgi:hypothetical protein
MGKRSKPDPLVRTFIETYHLNLLPIPRARAACGELYVKRAAGIAAPGDARELLEPRVQFPPVSAGEELAALRGTASTSVDARVGLGLLENFLVALGAGGIVDKLKAGYEQKRVRSVQFRLEDATRDSMDPLSLGTALAGRHFRSGHPWVSPENEYYIVAAVVRTPSLSLAAQDERSNTVDLDVDALRAVSAEAGIDLHRQREGEITYAGATPLAIGVELYQIRHDAESDRLEMLPVETAIALSRGRPAPPPPASFLGEDDDIFIYLEPEQNGSQPSAREPGPPGS